MPKQPTKTDDLTNHSSKVLHKISSSPMISALNLYFTFTANT